MKKKGQKKPKDSWTGPVTGEKCIRRMLVHGRQRYIVQMGPRGERVSKTFEKLADALAQKTAWEAGGVPKKDAPAVADAPPATAEDGLRHYVLKLRGGGQDAKRAGQLIPVLERELPELLAKPLDLVEVDDFRVFRTQRERPRYNHRTRTTGPIAPNTIIRDMRVLRAMVKTFRPDFKVPSEVFPAPESDRVRYLDPVAVVTVESALEVDESPTLQRLGRLMLLNITRQHDWRMLRRERVHLAERRVEFPASKGTVRALESLGEESCALLSKQLASHDGPWVFANPATREPYSRVHVGRVLRRAIRDTGRRDFTPHDLKHHTASAFAAAGATDRDLQRLGGWKTTGMLPKYAHVRSERLLALNEQIAARGMP